MYFKPSTRHPMCMWTPTNDWFKDISDLIIVVGGKQYFLHFAMINHKTLLQENVGYSNIVKTMRALESTSTTSEVFDEVVSFIYNDTCTITPSNALDIAKLSITLHVVDLYDKAVNVYRKHIDVDRVVEAWTYARSLRLDDMRDLTMAYILRNIARLCETRDFLELDVTSLDHVLSADELNLPDEMHVFRLILSWLAYQPGRQHCIRKLITCVRGERIALTTLVKQVYGSHVVLFDDEAKLRLVEQHEYWKSRNWFVNKRGVVERLPSAIEWSRPRICRDLVVAIGGYRGGSLNNIDCYDVRAGEWYPVTMKKPLPTRAYHGTVVVGRFVYLLGGFDANEDQLSSVLKVDLVTRRWYHVTNMMAARYFVSTTVCRGMVYVIGGYNGMHRLKTVECLDVQNMAWSKVAAMHTNRSDACCSTIKGLPSFNIYHNINYTYNYK